MLKRTHGFGFPVMRFVLSDCSAAKIETKKLKKSFNAWLKYSQIYWHSARTSRGVVASSLSIDDDDEDVIFTSQFEFYPGFVTTVKQGCRARMKDNLIHSFAVGLFLYQVYSVPWGSQFSLVFCLTGGKREKRSEV